jgi:hypothetical protein
MSLQTNQRRRETASEMREKQAVDFEAGAQEVWKWDLIKWQAEILGGC